MRPLGDGQDHRQTSCVKLVGSSSMRRRRRALCTHGVSPVPRVQARPGPRSRVLPEIRRPPRRARRKHPRRRSSRSRSSRPRTERQGSPRPGTYQPARLRPSSARPLHVLVRGAHAAEARGVPPHASTLDAAGGFDHQHHPRWQNNSLRVNARGPRLTRRTGKPGRAVYDQHNPSLARRAQLGRHTAAQAR